MQTMYGFTSYTIGELSNWLNAISVQRNIVRIQQHHTWRPNYSHFSGSNHFELQKNMKHYHVSNNGWSDIGQHFTIFPDGLVLAGRPLNKSPACIWGGNSGAICIENLGDFDAGRDSMRSAQRSAIVETTAALLQRFGLGSPSKSNIHYHHWWKPDGTLGYGADPVKSCPGSAFFGGNSVSNFESNFVPLVAGALGAPSSGPIGVNKWVSVDADQLNIRTAPSSSSELANDMGPVELGTVLRVFAEQNRWLKISNTKERWVFGRHTHDVRPKTVNTSDSNVRSGPGTEFEIIGTYQPGHKVFVHESDGSWSRIDADQWMHSSLLS